MQEMKLGIDVSKLPKTFQDAVFITRELGVRYLWIDSLCICQDDRKDWEVESSRMADVYAHAFVTISAARSSDDETGFLSARPERQYVPLRHSFNGVEDTVLAVAVPPLYAGDGDRYVQMDEEPLAARAWALQERCLSPRILHFGSSQNCYECPSHFITEDGYRSLTTFHDLSRNTHNSAREYDPNIDNPESWRELVFQYSHRQLSKFSDKLPALAGLAHRCTLGQGSEDVNTPQYCAGLWRNTIIEDLCWWPRQGKRPPKYRAPSWSWASLDGEVWFSLQTLGKPIRLAELEDVRVDVPGGNPYGEVSGGWLRLAAPVLPLSGPRAQSESETRSFHQTFTLADHCNIRIQCFRDVKDEGKYRNTDLRMVPLSHAEYKDDTGKRAYGLLVQPCEADAKYRLEGEVFQRLGFLLLYDTELVDSLLHQKREGTLPSVTIV